jgi:hypothetical protein
VPQLGEQLLEFVMQSTDVARTRQADSLPLRSRVAAGSTGADGRRAGSASG